MNEKVFIAGPMSTSGEPGPNVHAAACAAADLRLAGFDPFVPQLTWFLHMIRPDVPVGLWQQWDIRWLKTCDALLRLSGESAGADNEVFEAGKIGIPVFYSIKDLKSHFS